jgi:thioredoxin-like negative regulator of GroEL
MLKLNSDDHPEVAQRYGVMGLPTIKLFCRGRTTGELIGYIPMPRLKNEFERILQHYRECLEKSSPML